MKLKINGIGIECDTAEIGITNWDNDSIFYSHWLSLSTLGEEDVMLYVNLAYDEADRIREQIEAQKELSNKPDLFADMGCNGGGIKPLFETLCDAFKPGGRE